MSGPASPYRLTRPPLRAGFVLRLCPHPGTLYAFPLKYVNFSANIIFSFGIVL
jgi:hypothetical protein